MLSWVLQPSDEMQSKGSGFWSEAVFYYITLNKTIKHKTGLGSNDKIKRWHLEFNLQVLYVIKTQSGLVMKYFTKPAR